MNDAKRDLPCGTGYKSCFMVVEGSTQKNVSEAFLQGRKMKYTYDAKFINNEIDRLECKKCHFIKSEISGNSKTADMILEKTRFHYFEIHDLEMDGGQQTEWRDCAFENSAFENTKLCANISIAHGWLWNCKGQQLELIIEQLVSSGLTGCKFEGVKIGADITKNQFTDVEIQNLERIDMGSEAVWKENTLKNCMINGEIVKN